jgi:hypothetical protein
MVHPSTGRLIALAPRARPPGKGPSWGVTGPDLPAEFALGNAATWMSETYATPGRYPSEFLTLLVSLRDVHCRWPGCEVPAHECDIDHIDPYDPNRPPEATTVASNLHPLCRGHHLAKHEDGWSLTRDSSTGVTTWTDSTGKTYRVQPENIGLPPRTTPVSPDT